MIATSPAIEPTLTMAPERCAFMVGSTACMSSAGPTRLTSITSLILSAEQSQNDGLAPMPARLTSTSMRPNSASVAATSRSTSARCVMSVGTASTRAPCPRSSSANASSERSGSAAKITLAPRLASARAVTDPILPDAPAMSTTRSCTNDVMCREYWRLPLRRPGARDVWGSETAKLQHWMSDSDLTFYDLLGVSPQATPAELEGAYRALLIKVHPDISRLDNLDTHRLMAAVNEAWLTLKDPDKRAAYDEWLTDPTKRPASQTPAQSYLLEDDSDRGKSYVEQLDKFRAHWEDERQKAEEERVERERLALAAQEARESAWRVRRTIDQSVRDRIESPAASAWPIWPGAGVIAILADASVWLLWPRHTPSANAPIQATPVI